MSDYLPSDIVTQILLRLPVKSLIRFTTVCKSWRSLITSSDFISDHLSHSENYSLLRRYDKEDKQEHYSLFKKNGTFSIMSSTEFPFECQIGYFRIVGSCDGLVCISDDFFVNPSHPVILWNPSIRNHVVLPPSLISPAGAHIVALGFGVANHVYKVVRLVYSRKRSDYGFIVPPQAEVYSLSTGQWRELTGFDIGLRLLEFMWCQIFLNGFVHWLAYEPMDDQTTRCSILTFDFGDEVFGEIMLPDEMVKESITNLSLSIIEDSLGAIKYNGESGYLACDVWMMKEYGVKESWANLYRISSVPGFERVVGFRGSGEALLALMEQQLISYHSEENSEAWTEYLGIFGTPRSFYFDNYKESLILFGRFGRAAEELDGGAADDLRGNALEWLRNEWLRGAGLL